LLHNDYQTFSALLNVDIDKALRDATDWKAKRAMEWPRELERERAFRFGES
jgi:hypothetical protein